MSDASIANNLGTIITSPVARKLIYGIYAIGVIIIGAIQVAYSSVPAWGGTPQWLTAALAVAAYLGIPVATLAAANATNGSAKVTSATVTTTSAPVTVTPTLDATPVPTDAP